jgi:hypothetical protein
LFLLEAESEPQGLVWPEGLGKLKSVQSLSSLLLSLNISIKAFGTTTLQDVLYGFCTWFLILSEIYILRVFENRVLRGILHLRGRK